MKNEKFEQDGSLPREGHHKRCSKPYPEDEISSPSWTTTPTFSSALRRANDYKEWSHFSALSLPIWLSPPRSWAKRALLRAFPMGSAPLDKVVEMPIEIGIEFSEEVMELELELTLE